MRAIVRDRYGSPDVLRVEEVDTPVPREDEVLVRVRAASLNPLDWHLLRGVPAFIRLITGLRGPRDPRLGADFAGQVEAVGAKAAGLQPGDEVYGVADGSFGQYVRAAARKIAIKPATLTFEQAAAVPIAACTALQGLRDRGRIARGHKVLVNGAAGGVGTFAVQIARSFGAQVTGVCSTRNVDLVRSLGADLVVDYTREDFTSTGRRYDVVLDCVGNRSLVECRRVLAPRGRCVRIGGGGSSLQMIGGMLGAFLLSRAGSRKLVSFVASSTTADLTILKGLIEAGTVTPVIDRQYALDAVPEALRYLEEGHARGKVVVAVG